MEFRFIYVNGTLGETLEIEPFGFEASTVGTCETHYTGNENEIGATWTPVDITKDGNLEYNYFEGNGVLASGNIHDVHYVIPQSNAGLFVPKITIKTRNANDEITDTRTFTNVQLQIASHAFWLPGYVYRYQAELSPNKHYIHFTTSVKRWIDEDDRNQTITNGPAAGN